MKKLLQLSSRFLNGKQEIRFVQLEGNEGSIDLVRTKPYNIEGASPNLVYHQIGVNIYSHKRCMMLAF